MNRKSLQTLGLAQVAGGLISGEDQVLKAIKNKQAKLVLLARDAGVNTQKKLTDKCQTYQIPLIECYSRQELTQALGKKRLICCFIDNGFAKLWQQNEEQ